MLGNIPSVDKEGIVYGANVILISAGKQSLDEQNARDHKPGGFVGCVPR